MSADLKRVTTSQNSLSLSLSFLLTSCNLCDITYGVNTANGVGVGGVYVAAEDKSCMKENKEKISYYSSYNNHQN